MTQPITTINWQIDPTNMPQFHPRWLPIPPSSMGFFGKLPRELREDIFKPVIASGTTAITRCSKDLYDDTKDLLASHGVYRTQLVRKGDQVTFTHPAPPHSRFVGIRDVDITLLLATKENLQHCRESSQNAIRTLHGLIERMREHQSCYIRIVRETFCQFESSELAGFEFLQIFKTVTVEFLSLYYVNWFRDQVVKDGYLTPSSTEELSEGFGRIRASVAVKGLLDSGRRTEEGQDFSIKETFYNEGLTLPYQYPPELLHMVGGMDDDGWI